MNFLGIGPFELMVILVVALIIFGPDRLPEIGRALGRSVRQFQQFSQEITSNINEVREELESASESLTTTVQEVKGELEEASQSLRQATDIRGILESALEKPSPPREENVSETVISNEDVLPAQPEPPKEEVEEALEGDVVISQEDVLPAQPAPAESVEAGSEGAQAPPALPEAPEETAKPVEESSDIADFLPLGEPPAPSSEPTEELEAKK